MFTYTRDGVDHHVEGIPWDFKSPSGETRLPSKNDTPASVLEIATVVAGSCAEDLQFFLSVKPDEKAAYTSDEDIEITAENEHTTFAELCRNYHGPHTPQRKLRVVRREHPLIPWEIKYSDGKTDVLPSEDDKPGTLKVQFGLPDTVRCYLVVKPDKKIFKQMFCGKDRADLNAMIRAGLNLDECTLPDEDIEITEENKHMTFAEICQNYHGPHTPQRILRFQRDDVDIVSKTKINVILLRGPTALKPLDKPFLSTSGDTTIKHLKKYLVKKLDLPQSQQIKILSKGEVLDSKHTLAFVTLHQHRQNTLTLRYCLPNETPKERERLKKQKAQERSQKKRADKAERAPYEAEVAKIQQMAEVEVAKHMSEVEERARKQKLLAMPEKDKCERTKIRVMHNVYQDILKRNGCDRCIGGKPCKRCKKKKMFQTDISDEEKAKRAARQRAEAKCAARVRSDSVDSCYAARVRSDSADSCSTEEALAEEMDKLLLEIEQCVFVCV